MNRFRTWLLKKPDLKIRRHRRAFVDGVGMMLFTATLVYLACSIFSK